MVSLNSCGFGLFVRRVLLGLGPAMSFVLLLGLGELKALARTRAVLPTPNLGLVGLPGRGGTPSLGG